MNRDTLLIDLKQIRENYVETLKKLISIEEEIEKAVFYFQNLGQDQQKKMFATYENYVKNLNTLRGEMSQLMNDNISTIQSIMNTVNKEKSLATIDFFSNWYGDFMDFVFNYYNPFSWYIPGTSTSEKGK
jgi:predicted enzyme involved in methoxymalonyl-ACP biosynthesis